ncbi:MAG TPA: flagellar hook-basal body complex protein, partial [Ramlibacter sp.]|nr:flagellar hook-basal body complex protein [Ramlibacter sp.]
SIHVGMTGLLGYSRGLRVIANNTANLNTPGFKASTLQFTDLAYGGSGGDGATRLGHGLGTAGTTLDWRQGELRQTGHDFDLGLEGEGFFVLRNEQGEQRYTRAGQFDFDESGTFVSRTDGSTVRGRDASGAEVDISLAGLRVTAGKATGTVRFTGNLSSTATDQAVQSVKVHDSLGQEHQLTARFTRPAGAAPDTWTVEVLEGTTSVGTAQLVFEDGRPRTQDAKPSFNWQPRGRDAQALVLDFSSDVTSFASGNLSTLAVASQDGHAPGTLSKVAFDGAGRLSLTYTNGREVEGPQLLLARFGSADGVRPLGGNLFAAVEGQSWTTGVAGEGAFGAVRSGRLEVSNVDLSREFSELVVMQRGYQASSQVIGTANDMLQELFGMKRS